MTEEELAQLLAELEDLLRDLGLDFVVNQERVLAAEGVSTSAEDLGRRDVDDQTPNYSPQRALADDMAETGPDIPVFRTAFRRPVLKKTDVLVRPLNIRERLAVLLDLIEVTTAGTLAMEQLVQAELSETTTFEDPPEAELLGRTEQSWRIAGDVNDKTDRAAIVVGVVDELRSLADVPRGDWLRRHRAEDAEYTWAPTKEDQ